MFATYKLRTVSHNMFRTKPTEEEGLWTPAERPSLPVSLILEAITSFPSLGLTFPSCSNAKRNTCLKYGTRRSALSLVTLICLLIVQMREDGSINKRKTDSDSQSSSLNPFVIFFNPLLCLPLSFKIYFKLIFPLMLLLFPI